VLRRGAAAQGPSAGTVVQPQPWPLARTACLAPGLVPARVALLCPGKVTESAHPSCCNGLTHQERFKGLNLSGLVRHSSEGRGDERMVCTAWRVQGPGREQGHFARLGVMPRKGKTGRITGKKLSGVEELPSQGNLQTSSPPSHLGALTLGTAPSCWGSLLPCRPSGCFQGHWFISMTISSQPHGFLLPWHQAGIQAGTGLHPITRAQLLRITSAVNTAHRIISPPPPAPLHPSRSVVCTAASPCPSPSQAPLLCSSVCI